MRSLGEEIAVLDGLDALPGVTSRMNVVDPAEGANYSGGSSWTGGMPLLPSNSGLADGDVLHRSHVIDPTEGANYSGGSSWTGGMPLLPSNAGLAGLAADVQHKMDAGMERMAMSTLAYQQLINMLGGMVNFGNAIKEDGVWGNSSAEGLVRAIVMSGGDEEKDARAALPNIVSGAKGRILLMPTRYVSGLIREITKRMAAGLGGLGDASGVLPARFNVINPSQGANYSGGSSWTGGVPLVSSNSGLASFRDAGSEVFARYSDDMSDPAMFSGVNLGAIDATFGSSIEIEPNVTSRRNVIDASEGANYSGGSSWTGGMPLLPSNAGLAALNTACALDGLSDAALMRRVMPARKAAAIRAFGRDRLKNLKNRAAKIASSMKNASPAQRRYAQIKLNALDRLLAASRQARALIARG